ncbi:hypothetical protein HK099_005833 [Clydaea vesicula]|uniref:Uncharacterized protein n=1 Tax=Clydaea vesicula TaxID=447962 RepID=A0AAD5TYM5_9FUNG|nr:hypothetical protein HK099_005833 [Clydaea vesicula]KAJ3387773.1 hypothetical protein HDU92_001787 [Lobulomyces angularis]
MVVAKAKSDCEYITSPLFVHVDRRFQVGPTVLVELNDENKTFVSALTAETANELNPKEVVALPQFDNDFEEEANAENLPANSSNSHVAVLEDEQSTDEDDDEDDEIINPNQERPISIQDNNRPFNFNFNYTANTTSSTNSTSIRPIIYNLETFYNFNNSHMKEDKNGDKFFNLSTTCENNLSIFKNVNNEIIGR